MSPRSGCSNNSNNNDPFQHSHPKIRKYHHALELYLWHNAPSPPASLPVAQLQQGQAPLPIGLLQFGSAVNVPQKRRNHGNLHALHQPVHNSKCKCISQQNTTEHSLRLSRTANSTIEENIDVQYSHNCSFP